MSKSTTNVPWADAGRGFAMVLIVFGHTIGYCSQLKPLLVYLSSFYVPLFFILSGYLFQHNPQENMTGFMKRKALRILVPYYVFALLSLIPFYFFSGDIQSILASRHELGRSFTENILGILYASGHGDGLPQNAPLWFLPCYFTVIVLAKLVLEKVHKEKRYTNLFIAAGFLVIGYVIYRFFNYPYPYCLETALIMLFFFFLGRQLKVLHFGMLHTKIPFALIFLSLGFFFHIFNGKISCMNNSYGEYFIVFIVAAACSSIGYLALFRRFNPLGWLAYLGTHTIPFLVMHKMPIVFFQTKAPYLSQWLHSEFIVLQLFSATWVTTLTMLLCIAVYRITVKKLPWVFGE